MATVFIESFGNATSGFEFYSSTGGTVAQSGTAPNRVITCGSGAAGGTFIKQAILADAGRRITFMWSFGSYSASSATTRSIFTAFTSGSFRINVENNSGNRLILCNGLDAVLATGTINVKTGTPTLRITIAYTLTSTTVNRIKVWIDGVLDIDATNVTLNGVGSVDAQFADSRTAPALTQTFRGGIYVDDDSGLTDVGSVNVTAKLPAALNTNNFDTLGGSGANRYNRVSDRPLSETNYIEHAGATDVQENFGLQAASAGDTNVDSQNFIARTAWIWAKRGDVNSPKSTGSGAANSSGTVASTGNVNAAVGDYIIVAVADQMGGPAPTISDVSSNTYTALSGPTTNTVRASKWYSKVTNPLAGSISAVFTSANASRAIVAAVWDGALFSATPLDTNVTNANDSTTPFNCPTSGTLAQANEMVVGFTFSAGNTDFTATAPNLLAVSVASTGGGAAGNSAVAIGYQYVTATTAVVPVFAGTSRTSVQGTCSFKNPSAIVLKSTVGTPKIMDNGTETAVVLTTSPALYTVLTDDVTYPSNAAGIGMRSSGAAGVDTYMYECGTIIAYTVAAVAAATPYYRTPQWGPILAQ